MAGEGPRSMTERVGSLRIKQAMVGTLSDAVCSIKVRECKLESDARVSGSIWDWHLVAIARDCIECLCPDKKVVAIVVIAEDVHGGCV